jgi:hypothetical protein
MFGWKVEEEEEVEWNERARTEKAPSYYKRDEPRSETKTLYRQCLDGKKKKKRLNGVKELEQREKERATLL